MKSSSKEEIPNHKFDIKLTYGRVIILIPSKVSRSEAFMLKKLIEIAVDRKLQPRDKKGRFLSPNK